MLPSYTTVRFATNYQVTDSLALRGEINNLLDEEYYVIGFDVPVLSGYAGINAPPRTYGVTLNYRWQ